MTSRAPPPRRKRHRSLWSALRRSRKSRASPSDTVAMVGSRPYSGSLSLCHPIESAPLQASRQHGRHRLQERNQVTATEGAPTLAASLHAASGPGSRVQCSMPHAHLR